MSDKRQQLINASIDLFAEKGFWNTPTSAIAKHAGVATGTLFNYFATKEALIEAVYGYLKAQWNSYIEDGLPEVNDFSAAFQHVWARYIEYGLTYPREYRLMDQLRVSNLISPEAQHEVESSLSIYRLMPAIEAANLFGELPQDYVIALMLAQVNATIEYAGTLELRGRELQRLIDQSFRVFWSGVTQGVSR